MISAPSSPRNTSFRHGRIRNTCPRPPQSCVAHGALAARVGRSGRLGWEVGKAGLFRTSDEGKGMCRKKPILARGCSFRTISGTRHSSPRTAPHRNAHHQARVSSHSALMPKIEDPKISDIEPPPGSFLVFHICLDRANKCNIAINATSPAIRALVVMHPDKVALTDVLADFVGEQLVDGLVLATEACSPSIKTSKPPPTAELHMSVSPRDTAARSWAGPMDLWACQATADWGVSAIESDHNTSHSALGLGRVETTLFFPPTLVQLLDSSCT